MAKWGKYYPNYEKLYPGVEITAPVLQVLIKSDRKMKYMEVDIKHGKFVQDPVKQTAKFIPSREDSIERLCEEGVDFPTPYIAIEEKAIYRDEMERLYQALKELEPEEYALIHALYFDNFSEREFAAAKSLSQKAINKRRHKILNKLKKMMSI